MHIMLGFRCESRQKKATTLEEQLTVHVKETRYNGQFLRRNHF